MATRPCNTSFVVSAWADEPGKPGDIWEVIYTPNAIFDATGLRLRELPLGIGIPHAQPQH